MFNANTFAVRLNPFSTDFWRGLSEMAKVVAEIDALLPAIAAAISRLHRTPDEPFFWAKITGNSLPGSDAIWNYSFSEVETLDSGAGSGAWGVLSGGRSGSSALNSLEAGNTDLLAYGIPVDEVTPGEFNLTTAPFTASIFKPVPTGAIVRMSTVTRPTSGTIRYQFEAPNWISPECEA